MADGWIARKFNQSSLIGSVLDPVADKVLVGTMTATLLYTGQLSSYLGALIIGRDVSLLLGGTIFRLQSLPSIWSFFDPRVSSVKVHPSTISKLNTILQTGLIGLHLATPLFPISAPFMQVFGFIVGGSTILSGLSYLKNYRKAFKLIDKK